MMTPPQHSECAGQAKDKAQQQTTHKVFLSSIDWCQAEHCHRTYIRAKYCQLAVKERNLFLIVIRAHYRACNKAIREGADSFDLHLPYMPEH